MEYIINTVEALVQSKEFVPSKMQIRCQEDRLIIFFPSRRHSKGDICQETYIIPYKGIIVCEYLTKSTSINILGEMEFIRYRYDKNGNLPDKPSRHIIVKDGGMSFNIRFDMSIIDKIEEHTPLHIVPADRYI